MTVCCCFFETPRSVSPERTGAKLDKIPTKFRILRGGYRRDPSTFILRRTGAKISLLKNISAPKLAAPPLAPLLAGLGAGFKTGEVVGQYGGSSIIAPEYKPAEAACRSRDAPGARKER